MATSLLLFILGACLGSFLSATAQRLKKNKSNLTGFSFCDHCQKKLSAKDLVPILSYLFFRGRCRFCHQTIGWREPVTEIVTGLIFVLTGLAYDNQLNILLLAGLIFSTWLVLLFLTDVYTGLLPHRFTLAATASMVVLNFWIQEIPPPQILYGILACGGFFFLQHVISRGRWVGGGDVGMGAFLGASLGLWYGIWAIGLAYVIGAFFAIFLLITKKATSKSQIPFGPFLALAGWLVSIVTAW